MQNAESRAERSNLIKLIVVPLTDRKTSVAEVDSRSKCIAGSVKRFSQHTKGNLLVFIGPAALQRPGDKPQARAQQIAGVEVKAQTIRLGSEASILLQRQTTPDNVSRSSMLGVANNNTLIHTLRRNFMDRMRNYGVKSLTGWKEKGERGLTGSERGRKRCEGVMLLSQRIDQDFCPSVPP